MADAPHIAGPSDFAKAFDVSRETIERLKLYADLLLRWQKAVNLVAPGTLDDVWHRHIADSAQFVDLLPQGATKQTDLGSGGGFPGLVIAIMRADQPLFRTTMVESDQRKSAFLREVARQTGIAVDIVNGRIENPETHAKVASTDVVTARALAPLGRLLELSAAYYSVGTIGLFAKGREVDQELDDARRMCTFEHRLVPSVTQLGAYIVEIRGLCVRPNPG